MRYFIEFMNKYGNKIFWSILACLWIFNFWQMYQDPSGTWKTIKTNLQNPWYWIPIGFMILILCVIPIWAYWKKKIFINNTLSFISFIQEKSSKETRLMNSDEIPSNEDIVKYYKMYCIKFELDNEDIWTTNKPMSFEEWEKKSKTPTKSEDLGDGWRFKERGAWEFMISKTSDIFSSNPVTGQSTMMRFRDYENMIDKNDYKDLINRQLDIE